MTLRYTENMLSTTSSANKLIVLTEDNKLPVVDGSNLINVPETTNLVFEEIKDQATLTLSVNKMYLIYNELYSRVTNIYFPNTANTGDRIYIHMSRDSKNKYILNIENNNIFHYKCTPYSNQTFDLVRTKSLSDEYKTSWPTTTTFLAQSSYNTFYKLICYNDGTNINWIDENNLTSLTEISSTIKSNFNNNEVLCTTENTSTNLSNSSFSTREAKSSITFEFTSAYNLATYNISTAFYTNWTSTSSHLETVNIIINSSTITSLTLPLISSYPQCIRLIRGNSITQTITLNVNDTVNERFHTKNSSLAVSSTTYTWNHNRSLNFLPSQLINSVSLTSSSWMIFGET